MEFIVEKIGMSRTVGVPSIPVTLLKIVDIKVCEIREDGSAVVAYSRGKKLNKPIEGQQKKYNLSKEFNRFAILNKVNNSEVGDLDLSPLESATIVQSSFNTKGRGFTGVVKRYGFGGGPRSHGSRFHRRVGSIDNAEFPGRVQPGQKMPGHYGNKKNSVKNEVVSFDKEQGILVVKGSVSGPNGAIGRLKVVK
ncbi:MAG TPA: 50S ribosomal protein L3 [Campylobacterales bacterium]|nr:50S ribosomal protein L3 [Campylobacterales bacterium]